MEKSQSLCKKSRLFLKFYKTSREYQEIKTKSWQYQENQEKWIPWVKVQNIGQAIIKSSTRTALTPILFGLGVELDHVFGWKWLLDSLARVGFSVAWMKLNYTNSSVLKQQFNWLVKLFKLLFCSVECWQRWSWHSNLPSMEKKPSMEWE